MTPDDPATPVDENPDLLPGHEGAAASHLEALGVASELQRTLSDWQPTAHLRYLETARAGPTGLSIKLAVPQKARALEVFAQTGRVGVAAAAAGVCPQTIANHLKDDPDFATAWANAKTDFADRLQMGLYQRGYIGSPEPIVGRVAKDCDGIIGYKLNRSDNIALAMAKAFMPETYGDRHQVDVNVSGGVLVVGAQLSPEDWLAQHGGPQPIQTIPLLEEIRAELTRDGGVDV